MNTQPTQPSMELLKELALASGPPGMEDEVRSIVHREIGQLGTMQHDGLGSVVIESPGTGPRVVLDAHMDEVGFCVQSVDAEGRIYFVPLGGWWGHVLLAQRVDILSSGGTKIPGTIGCKPPHFLSPGERDKVLSLDKMYIDVAARGVDEVESWGIRVGDPIVPRGHFEEMASAGRYCCKAFDDRVGVGVLIESFKALVDGDLDLSCQPVAVAAVQEEVGCRGAQTAGELSRPEVAIILEGTPADDLPGMSQRQAVLGGGPQIRFMDPTALSNRKLVRWTEDIAEQEGIPVQVAVRRSGGTDAKPTHLHGSGVPTVVIGVPARSIHTHSSIIDGEDYALAIRLVTAMVQELDEATVAGFVDYNN
ncbi:MAG: M20/M25/M40 family metallo-hydrolase [Planctomycetia bacterium]|nr:M20/M25/M40 family metallo-hydrolase [Planctomycetia bacterium]NCF97878.1 M20/M25/M40 family metallo-hydrolase [Planctomycetia bacterium]NCG12847.1 M20/M25/M40 family metallo-hydrolase [Planctomycetia bacterium]NCG55570.1 M20/M25/M40 family metallo-hydrolase [Pseudomonadota bacterium]